MQDRFHSCFSGLTKHHGQTNAPGCLAARDALRAAAFPTESGVHSGDNSTSPSPSPPAEPGQAHAEAFRADYFGDYREDDFLQAEDADNFEDDDGLDGNSVLGLDSSESDTNEDAREESGGWEPAPEPLPSEDDTPPSNAVDPDSGDALPREADLTEADTTYQPNSRAAAERSIPTKTFVVRLVRPLRSGRAVIGERVLPAYSMYKTAMDGEDRNIWAPFRSRIDWEIARWAKMHGPGSTAVSELLAIENLAATLGFSYTNTAELNKIIDDHLVPSGRPRFKRREIVVQGEAFEVYYRDILECICALFGDPEFANDLLLVPERHYTDKSRQTRVFFDMHTGDWWWRIQKILDRRSPGGTVIPVIIISSDKTQLTVFGNKTAYPVYLTIGNLPKDVRRKPSHRGQVLLAYLLMSNLEHISNKASQRRTLLNLFHACMRHILAPLKSAGENGVSMARGDGMLFRCHPILAAYIGDYPEQILVACCTKGDWPKCPIPRDELGNSTDTERAIRDIATVLEALDTYDNGATAYKVACERVGIKPVIRPFWQTLPYVDIYVSITPDILHQLYQGMIKHLISWIKQAYGPIEIDARCRRMPPNHRLRHFYKGISKLQRVTGREHADICRILMGLLLDLPLPGGLSPARLVRATRALLDFLYFPYVAQYPIQTTVTIAVLRDALVRFHANKSIFINFGIHFDFDFPKLHSLDHFPLSTRLFGSPDNFNTQYSECLHIDFAKDAYRATNQKDEFAQMSLWLERREKVQRHEAFLAWQLSEQDPAEGDASESSANHDDLQSPLSSIRRSHHKRTFPSPSSPMLLHLVMTKQPSAKGVHISQLINTYSARIFREALARFVVQYRHPDWSAAQVERAATAVYLPFSTVPVYHKAKFLLADSDGRPGCGPLIDVVPAHPACQGKYGHQIPGCFDTALINCGTGQETGVAGYCVGQVRVIFKIPKHAIEALFPDVIAPKHLAYVEWVTAFTQPHRDHGMYRVSRSRDRQGTNLASIVEVSKIRRSCHLFPHFGSSVLRDWTSADVLDRSPYFWVNPYSDCFMYTTTF
ncbi:hypothetical protein OH77DRAFT_1465870 [Trametes cingulata]|nr:hypothetical protein OH77DRAFT_1465870 [Trametes cingulata]